MMKKRLKKLARLALYLMLLLGLLAVVLLDRVDWTPYAQLPVYAQARQTAARFALPESPIHNDTIRAGWAKQNITPDAPLDMAGYGMRGEFERVHDSLWARAVVFADADHTVALLNLDLLIVHPLVADRIRQQLTKSGIRLDDVYFTASHTHNGYGEWAPGIAGKLMAGGYDEQVVNLIVNKSVTAIQQAMQRLEPVRMGFARHQAGAYVRNRLDDKGATDPWLRVVHLQNRSGKTALISTFSAHATSLESKIRELSADYPGVLTAALEKHPGVDFAVFCMGATASHAPVLREKNFYHMQRYGTALADTLAGGLGHTELSFASRLEVARMPVLLREPQYRITEQLRLRPWVFKNLFGELNPDISCLRIGNTLFVGTPCDFTGELYPGLEKMAQMKGLNLMITSFNGHYIGYVTNDRYYHLKRGETRDMNWFGPGISAYFNEILTDMLRRL